VSPHVEPDAVAERLLAEVALDHPQDRPALLVGDEVEALGRLVGVVDLGADGVRRAERVEVQRARLALVELEPDPPLGLPRVHDLERHPGGERLVEPEVVPPRIVTQLPNHWCASSCVMTSATRFFCGSEAVAGSSRSAISR
jgi:hypothetical protein